MCTRKKDDGVALEAARGVVPPGGLMTSSSQKNEGELFLVILNTR
jgi:hypothetical protein